MSFEVHAKNLRHAERIKAGAEIVIMDDDRDTLLGYMLDISLKGMRLMGLKPLPPRRRFHFRLEPPPALGLPPLTIYGICVRCDEIYHRDEYESGVLFELVTGRTRDDLKRLIAQLDRS